MLFFDRADLVPMNANDFAEFLCQNYVDLIRENSKSKAAREIKIIIECVVAWAKCKDDDCIADMVQDVLARAEKIRNEDLGGKLFCLIATSISLTHILGFEDLVSAIKSHFWKLETFAKSVEAAAWARVRHGGRLRRMFSQCEMNDLLIIAEFLRSGELELAEEYLEYIQGKVKYVARKFLVLAYLLIEGNVGAAAELAVSTLEWRREEGGIFMPVLFSLIEEGKIEEARIFADRCARTRGRVMLFFCIALITGCIYDIDRVWKETRKLRDKKLKEWYWSILTIGYRYENKVVGRQNIEGIKDPLIRCRLLRKLLDK